ncbi:transposase [Anatilimnocola floriformis]|uniref:transposase n=1 Tax=Anatilimnocola floriformis TaxID=2948575 RepID=UPI0020C22868|nr:transposase [Anatilimnocola floriformis]
MWNLPAPPGFLGLDEHRPLRVYYRALPHWRQEGATYFTTFRLGDSIPDGRLRELTALRAQWERLNPPPRSESQWQQISHTTMVHIERWLDEGSGSCILQDLASSSVVEQKLKHFDGVQYELGAYVIMPNHVHVLVRPYSDEHNPLESIVQAWKANAAREINLALGQSGQLWQHESFDRIVRDEEHLWRCLQYIGDNARRANLAIDRIPRWINPKWTAAGWLFENLGT